MNDDTLRSLRGDCLKAIIHVKNVDGSYVDLFGKEISVSSASHPSLMTDAEFTDINVDEGTVAMYVPAATMALIPYGRSSWFRLAITEGPAFEPPPDPDPTLNYGVSNGYELFGGGGSLRSFLIQYTQDGDIAPDSFYFTNGACQVISLEGVVPADFTFVSAIIWDVASTVSLSPVQCLELKDHANSGSVDEEFPVAGATVTVLNPTLLRVTFVASEYAQGTNFDCVLDVLIDGTTYRVHFQSGTATPSGT